MNTMINECPAKPASRLIAFHGQQAIKDTYLERVRQHRAADDIRQGFGYWKPDDDGCYRGCAVGCTLHSDDHMAYERELGIPIILARLEDRLFEGMPASATSARAARRSTSPSRGPASRT